MYAVGRLGSYISRGVYTVSGPFHPFGGAVDIIVVEQEDGSFKSSAWNVRFGKFQGVLKTKEKVVNINVNGEEAKFHMYLNHKGEAYFLRQADVEGKSVLYPSSSSDERDEQSQENRQPLTLSRINSKTLSRTNSRRSRIFGIFGSRSMKERKHEEGEKGDDGKVERTESLARAEFAANLLEVKWSTSLATNKPKKDYASCFSCPDMSGIEINGDVQIDSEKSLVSSSLPVTRVPSDVDESLIGETEQVFDEKDVLLPGCGIAQKAGEIDRVQSFIYCESSESSIEGIDGASEETHETLYIARGGSGQVRVHAESVHARTELLSKDTVTEQLIEDVAMEVRPVEVPETYSQETAAHSCTGNHNADLEGPASVLLPVGSEEERFLFSDHDELKITKVQCMESSSSLCEDGENNLPCSPEGSKELNGLVNTNYESYSSPEKFVQENPSVDFEKSIGKLKVISSTIDIPRNHKAADEEAGRLVESLPNMWPQIDNLSALDLLHYPLSHSLDSNAKPLKWIGQSKDDLSCRELERDKEQQLALEKPDIENAQGSVELKDGPVNPAVGMVSFGKEQIFEPKDTIAVDRVETNITGDPSQASVASSGSWKLWPFAFRRSNSRKAMQPDLNDCRNPDAGNASESTVSMDGDKNMLTTKGMKKMERATAPTSEQLVSLNLKEGKNTVTFTFSTGMLGEQQVDARIYLWKWNTRIVISDVDGTITKSDVLGQFMPLVGVDWSQTGVTHLFSAIKENGYQLLFLSARAISQAHITRQFLFNLKQDGKALPDGPVVISPDGLFPSLYREVIRRAPHEFKISCLEDIKSLFPSDCNPFYAGFGNRDTDEVSYLRVGIPKGKIFIINPKGEIAVNRSVDTKSYTSLHALVNGMFPPATSYEQEDFNSWNFWKLPPPNLDD